MTAMLDKPSIPLHGSMLPRVYTPPLEVNLIGPSRDEYGAMQECPCGCGLSPETSYGFSCSSFLTRVMKWNLMPWQRWLYIHALEKKPDRSCFRFQTTVVLVARQQGKTRWLKGLGLWRLFLDTDGNEPTAECPNALLAIIAAQNLDYAETMLKEVVDDIREHPLLRKELVNHRVTNGKHRAILTNKRYWRAATATRKGARSLSVDIAMLDELREHTTSDAWNAITATTTVRPLSQVIAASNAGDQRSEVLRSLRDSATRRIATKETEDSQTALFEWSVPMDVDPRDPQYWYMANPSMGHLNEFTINDLRGRLEAMEYRNMPGFQTEHLALDITTPILTTGGWKTMETIEVGDQVYHPDGHPIDVVHVTPIYTDRPCYEVVTTDGRSVVADDEHRWTVNDRRSNRGWEVFNTGELVRRGLGRNAGGGGAYAFRLPRQYPIISKPVDLPIDPYLLGAWLGDGTAGKAEITCIESEADELTELLQVNVTSVRAAGNARRINFRTTPQKSRDGFPAHCRALGIWNDKHIPDPYLTAGTEQRLALLQGLCDTDGSIDTNGRIRFCSTRKDMAEQVLYLARSLGWRATIRTGVSSYGGKVCGPAYYVSWTHDADEPAPFRLRRKLALIQKRPSRAGERTTVSIRSVTPVDSRPVRCITVSSPDSLFLAGRGLVSTRNCQWVDALEPGIIPAEHWQETLDPVSRRDETAKVYAALDVNYERSRSFIAIAARRPDGKLHVEVIQAARGTEWVVPWLQERKGKFAAVAVQKTGAPASGMIDDLRRAGLKVVEWGPGTEIVAGSGMFYDLIVQHEVYHRPAPLLDRAAGSAIARRVADGWIFDRRNSPVDVSPLVACAAAVWAEHSKIPGPPTVHSWPEEDEMQQWEQEADASWEPKPTGQNWRDSEEQTWWPR